MQKINALRYFIMVTILALILTSCKLPSNSTPPFSQELQAVLDTTRASVGLMGNFMQITATLIVEKEKN